MDNIWSFLAQTLSVSLTAALLLVVKRLFLDKLSPRWQYGIWGILALRILLPAGLWGRYALVDLRLWLEAAKTAAERNLSSVLSDPFALTRVTAPVPVFPHGLPRPGSVTDLLFYLYAAGIAVTLLWFLFSYLRLRLTLRGAAPAGGEDLARLEEVCRRYNLRAPKRVVTLPGTESAFVCGPLRPVLVLPADRPADEKVLLHELLHLKYGDVWAGVLLCVLRCLHWCNPLIWTCCDRAQNDCEALCDQRVLERLEGEERRDYGRILLSMADDAHARAPGTSSMANGGENIKRRIQAIARFKRYPAGMALASGCVAVILAMACLVGTTPAAAAPSGGGPVSLSMARARLSRPTTPAGALDTYVKARRADNGLWLASVVPSDGQEAFWQALAGAEDFHLGLSAPLAEADYPWISYHRQDNINYQARWQVLNLLPDGAGGYEGLLMLAPSDSGEESILAQTVRILPDDGGWAVAPSGPLEEQGETVFFGDLGPELPVAYSTYTARAGGLELEIWYQYLLDARLAEGQSSTSLFFGGSPALGEEPIPDAPFTGYTCTIGGTARNLDTGEEVPLSVEVTPLSSGGEEGGCTSTISLPEEPDGSGGGFYFNEGVGLDCAASLSLTFHWEGQDYTCTALPEGGAP